MSIALKIKYRAFKQDECLCLMFDVKMKSRINLQITIPLWMFPLKTWIKLIQTRCIFVPVPCHDLYFDRLLSFQTLSDKWKRVGNIEKSYFSNPSGVLKKTLCFLWDTSFVFCVVFCRSFFDFLSVYVPFLRLVITPLV